MKRKHRKGGCLKIFLCGIAVGLLCWAIYSYFYLPSGKVAEQSVPSAIADHNAKEIPSGEQIDTVTEYIPELKGKLVRHSYYVLSYNSTHKQADWVYYSPHVKTDGEGVGRTDNFREDPMVAPESAKPSDYTKSGYDRGHLCPAGDMTQCAEAMSETFYMSNMSPQVPGFNRGIWKTLEEQVREWGKKGMIYVVTGPVFKEIKGEIGQNKVTVPGYYYKVIYSPSRQQMIGFILPNEKSNKRPIDFVVSVDSVEHFTGIDFFPQLPDSLENRLESRSDYQRW